MPPSSSEPPPSVTESPWYWAMIFALAALAGIATIAPKFERRQEIIETKFHARERAQGRESLDEPLEVVVDVPGDERPWRWIFTLGPLLAIIGVIALAAFAGVARLQKRRLQALRQPDETAPTRPPA